LREEFTDIHPRVVALRAERARVEAELTDEVPQTVDVQRDPVRLELRRQLAGKDGQRARIVSRIAALLDEERMLAEFVRTEVPAIEERARRLTIRLKDTARDDETVSHSLDSARRAANENRASKAAITVRSGSPPPQVLRSGASLRLFSVLGVVFGLVAGGLLAAFAEALDPVIRTSEDVRRHLDLPVLAAVPRQALRLVRHTGRQRALGALVWAVGFLLAAAFLLTLVYPGWDRLRALFALRESKRPLIEEVGR
jgi:hypothetical protein